MFTTLFTSLLLTTTYVSAHGFTRGFRVQGGAFDNGSEPGVGTPKGPIRQVTTADPVLDVTSDDMICGPGAVNVAAPRSYPVEVGGTMFFTWAGKTKDLPWGHEFGPILTYLASCEGKCGNFDASKATWYKIDQLGQKDGGKSNVWFQADLKTNPEVTVKLPLNVPNGEYLLRHEIIVLNSASTRGGAQFYPSCTQIKVSGAPTNAGLPSPKVNGVSFPGAYKADDPGILVPNAFRPDLDYQFPGGPVIEFGGEGVTKTSSLASETSSTASQTSSSTVPRSSTVTRSIATVPGKNPGDPSSAPAFVLPSSTVPTTILSSTASSISSQRTGSVTRLKTLTSATTEFTTSFGTATASSATITARPTTSLSGDNDDVDVITSVQVTTIFERTTVVRSTSRAMTTVLFATVIPVDEFFAAPESSPTITSTSTPSKSTSVPALTATTRATLEGVSDSQGLADSRYGGTHRYPTRNFNSGRDSYFGKNRRAKNWTNRLEPDFVLFD